MSTLGQKKYPRQALVTEGAIKGKSYLGRVQTRADYPHSFLSFTNAMAHYCLREALLAHTILPLSHVQQVGSPSAVALHY